MRGDGTTGKQLDSTIQIVAPENVAFGYRLAGPFVRAFAFSLDALIIGAEILAFWLGSATLCRYVADAGVDEDLARQISIAASLLNMLLVFWFWNAAFEAFWRGRTIGKAAFRLRVLTTEGRPIGRGQAILRNVLRTADLALGPFVAPILAGNDRMARLGDLAAGTLVVVEDRDRRRGRKQKEKIAFQDPEILKIAAAIPTDFEISDSLRKALALYASRRTQISPSRRLEIAAPLCATLVEKSNFPFRVNPDLFLCALYRRSLGDRSESAPF